jgi:DNA-binding HxlR family transcriptional regulator
MKKYIIQKSEKIASAIYLITDCIKDSDFLKWEIREESLHLISSALIIGNDINTDKEYAYKEYKSVAEKILSLLRISELSKIVSKMNARIVHDELNTLINYLDTNKSLLEELSGYILSENYFATENISNNHKGHENKSVVKSNNNQYFQQDTNKISKKDRSESILELLNKQSNLSIKDFSRVIKDCSEKTIQRELTLLVQKGLVKKEGERRSTTYSLNSTQNS